MTRRGLPLPRAFLGARMLFKPCKSLFQWGKCADIIRARLQPDATPNTMIRSTRPGHGRTSRRNGILLTVMLAGILCRAEVCAQGSAAGRERPAAPQAPGGHLCHAGGRHAQAVPVRRGGAGEPLRSGLAPVLRSRREKPVLHGDDGRAGASPSSPASW